MPIIVNLDVMLAKRKMSLSQLSEQVDVTIANLSRPDTQFHQSGHHVQQRG